MSVLSNYLYKRSFCASPNIYQKKYNNLEKGKNLEYLEKRIIQRNRSVSEKSYNIQTSDSDIISATYFENYIKPSSKITPIIIYFYGNSWSSKNPIHFTNYCTNLAVKTESAVIAINYRQSPESKFPNAVYNAYDSIKWVKKSCPYWQMNSDKIYIFGDCCGANLALAASLLLRHDIKILNIAGLVLVDPLLDARLYSKSSQEYYITPTLTKEDLQRHISEYINNQCDLFDEKLSINMMQDFTKLPPTLIISAGRSPLLDDAYILKKKLDKSMVSNFHFVNRDAYYGFLYAKHYPEKRKIERIIKGFIRNNDINYLNNVII